MMTTRLAFTPRADDMLDFRSDLKAGVSWTSGIKPRAVKRREDLILVLMRFVVLEGGGLGGGGGEGEGDRVKSSVIASLKSVGMVGAGVVSGVSVVGVGVVGLGIHPQHVSLLDVISLQGLPEFKPAE